MRTVFDLKKQTSNISTIATCCESYLLEVWRISEIKISNRVRVTVVPLNVCVWCLNIYERVQQKRAEGMKDTYIYSDILIKNKHMLHSIQPVG
jgi:hypothetical protein